MSFCSNLSPAAATIACAAASRTSNANGLIRCCFRAVRIPSFSVDSRGVIDKALGDQDLVSVPGLPILVEPRQTRKPA